MGPELWDGLLAGAEIAHAHAGTTVHPLGTDARPAAVLSGIVRIFTVTPNARRMTVRYVREGELYGVIIPAFPPFWWGTEALTDATVALMSFDRVRALAAAEPHLSWAIAEAAVRAGAEAVSAAAGAGSAPMVARVAGHLLQAVQRDPAGETVAFMTQERLADAVGTSREMVTRVVSTLRDAGIVATARGRIVLLDHRRLTELARGGSGDVSLRGTRREPGGRDSG